MYCIRITAINFYNPFYLRSIIYCRESDIKEDLLVDVVRNVFVDLPPTRDKEYHFDKTPPKLTGQIGIPVIVDKLLGISFHTEVC